MQVGVHGQRAHFRISAILLQAAEDKARREGMTLSELVRAAIRREVQN